MLLLVGYDTTAVLSRARVIVSVISLDQHSSMKGKDIARGLMSAIANQINK